MQRWLHQPHGAAAADAPATLPAAVDMHETHLAPYDSAIYHKSSVQCAQCSCVGASNNSFMMVPAASCGQCPQAIMFMPLDMENPETRQNLLVWMCFMTTEMHLSSDSPQLRSVQALCGAHVCARHRPDLLCSQRQHLNVQVGQTCQECDDVCSSARAAIVLQL